MSEAGWEKLRGVPLETLVTHVKQTGGNALFFGNLAPEGYAFSVCVAVGVPGNENAVQGRPSDDAVDVGGGI